MSTTFARIFFPPINLRSQLADLLRIMCESKALTLAKYADCDPIRTVFDAGRIDDMADRLLPLNTFYWNGIDGITKGAISLGQGRGKQTASLSVGTDIEQFDHPNDLPEAIQKVATRFGASYGFVHYLSEAEVTRLSGSDTIVGNEYNPYMLMISRWKLVRCLPNLDWGNIFGPEYVALFGGRDRVAAAPAAIVKELSPNTFYIQLSDNMLDFAMRHAQVDAVRERVKEYLGADCFFDY
jgi:hypothetical protein